jgi:large subunit ribosomal protein L33
MRELVDLECTACRRRNYAYKKNKNSHPDRMELKKYCRFCRAHTAHRETK